MSTINARFASTCPKCKRRIAPGELVNWTPGSPATHLECGAIKDIRIEFPCAGATYHYEQFGVYEYGTYERSSVLAGQESRRFLNRFLTEEEAQVAYPEAKPGAGCGYRAINLNHLPGDDDPSGVFAEQDYWDRVENLTGVEDY